MSFEIDSGMIDPANPIEEPLMSFRKLNGDFLNILTYEDKVIYDVNGERTTEVVGYDVPHSVGFDINAVLYSSTSSNKLKRFFSNISDIELFVGGDGTQTFSGFIYNVGIGRYFFFLSQ